MQQNDTEKTILAALTAKNHNTGDASFGPLARSIAATVSYDPSLKDITPDEIAAVIRNTQARLTHEALVAEVRAWREHARQGLAEMKKADTDREEEDAINMGFLTQCLGVYERDSHLGAIRQLTLTFLSNWLRKKKELIQDDEIDWCVRQAVRDAEPYETEEKERRQRLAFEEAVVLLVINKIQRTKKKEPEKTATLISSWEKRYQEYFVKRFGRKPDNTLPEGNRPAMTKAFPVKKTQK